VSQSDANRQRLSTDWQRLQSPETWLDEIAGIGRRHPWWTVSLAAMAGILAAKTLRHPRTFIGRVGRLGKFASLAFTVWRLLRRKWRSG